MQTIIRNTLSCALIALFTTLPGLVRADAVPRAGGEALLGSPAFAPTPQRPLGWRGDGSGRYPAAVPPIEWSRKRAGDEYKASNFLWQTRLPAPSVASPIIVGDRIFVTGEVDDLICLEKASGKVLWIASNPEWEAIAEAERGADPDVERQLSPLPAELIKLNAKIVEALNQPGDEKTLQDLQTRKRAIDKQMYDVLLKRDKKRFDRYWGQGVFGFAGTTPTTDGRNVCVFFTTGVVACYDLQGKRKWIDRGKGGCSEHGNFASPVLVDNRLVVWAAEMRGYDVNTGKILFANPAENGNTYGSMFRLKVGAEWVAGFQSGYFTRISDGKPIWGEHRFGDAVPTPIVENNMIYTHVGYPRNSEGLGFKAYKIPATTDEELKPAYTFKIDWSADEIPIDEKKRPFDRSYCASPLYVDGLIYQMTQGGGLTVSDAATGAQVYRKVLPMNAHTQYWNWAGASVSPTLGGRHIYLMDNQGTTVVIKPGKVYEEVARNVIEEFSADGKTPAQNLSTPVFEATRMYYRSPGYMYCIGER